jgi:hypothetical protein
MKILTLLYAVLFTSTVLAKDYLDLSKKLASLRTQVERLNENVQEVRRNYSSELRSYSMQRAELEATIRKEEIKKKQLLEKVTRLKGQLGEDDKGHKELLPMVNMYVDKLTAYVETSIPYKKEERILNLSNLRKELDKGEVKSYKALARLWSAFEDEQRLTRENQITKERIEVDGKKYLAEVLKLGSLSLYFRLDNGKFGKAVKSGDEWKFTYFNDDSQSLAAGKLFEGIRKQIKIAEYTVPSAIEL